MRHSEKQERKEVQMSERNQSESLPELSESLESEE